MTHTSVDGHMDRSTSSAQRTADPANEFTAAMVLSLRQRLTALNVLAQIAKRVIETDPVRASGALDEASQEVMRIDRMLTELQLRTEDRPADASATRPPEAFRDS